MPLFTGKVNVSSGLNHFFREKMMKDYQTLKPVESNGAIFQHRNTVCKIGLNRQKLVKILSYYGIKSILI